MNTNSAQPLESDAEAQRKDRSAFWASTTALVQFGAFLLYPALISGDHFSPTAVPMSMVPVVWGAVPLIFGRTPRERMVAYVAVFLSLCWLAYAWFSNIQFAFSA